MSRIGSIWHQLLEIGVCGAWILTASSVTAQITPDRTLPNNSSVTINGSIFQITGGTQSGRNLFHSFQQFSVPTGRTASFNNGLDINNIISRVTGGSVSKIDGLITASGTANLFFLNPSGIVFGKNARLDIGGSFVASTSSSLKFADGFEYSATANPTPPLLTISVPTGLQFGTNPGGIQVQGDGQGIRQDNRLIDTQDALRVKPNQTLALVGGDITLEGGTLKTVGGRIELGSVAGNGLVTLTPINKGFSLGYGGVKNFGNIQLSQQSDVDASGEGGGDIQVWGRNVTLTDGSQIETITLGSQQGGSLVVNAQESVRVAGVSSNLQFLSSLRAETAPGTQGAGGNVTINTGKLVVQDGGLISANIYGAGSSGDLIINASDSVEVTGATGEFGSALVVQQNQANGTGSARNLKINTHQLFLSDGAFVGTETSGAGNGGSLTINADSVDIIGGNNRDKITGLSTQAKSGSTGNAGNLTINTHDLLIKNGASVSSSTNSVGNGGNLTINATGSVQLIGTSPNGEINTLLAQAQDNATGAAGNLTINTNQLLVQDGGLVSTDISNSNSGNSKSGGNLTINATDFVRVIGTSPDGKRVSGLSTQIEAGAAGASGNLTINTHELLVQGGAFVSSSTNGSGNGGNLKISADSVQVIGTSILTGNGSSLLVEAEPGSSGNAGDLTINTRELLVQGGAFVGAGTYGAGNGGNLTVTADSIHVIGTSADGAKSSGLSTQAEKQSTGSARAGDLTINTRELLIQGGAFVSSGTKSSGNGGDLKINAQSVQVIGTSANGMYKSSLLAEAQPGSSGNAGNLTINTRDLVIRGDGKMNTTERGDLVGVLVRSRGTGNAGNLTINADFILLDNNATLIGDTQSIQANRNTEQATITLHSKDLILTRGSNITTNATGSNVIGGDIKIDTDILAAVSSIISAKSANFRGGRVMINASSIFRSDDTNITATGASPQLNGTVQINTLNIDPSPGLITLPTVTENTPKPISSNCSAFNETNGGSSFTITGRGGLPPSPNEPLIGDAILIDTHLPVFMTQQHQHKTHTLLSQPEPVAIVPATGWVFNDKGEVTLISTTLNATSVSTPTSCSAK